MILPIAPDQLMDTTAFDPDRRSLAPHEWQHPDSLVPVAAENLTVTLTDDTSVTADGQIDSHTSPSLDDVLSALADGADLAVDLSRVTFVDSSGLRVLVRAHKRQLGGGGRLTIVDPSEPVRRLLDITGLTGELHISG